MENQRNYQNDLAARFSMQSIMTSHRSVGFEYEFGQHNQGPEVLSHLHLAASQPFSNLFPLKFELETDSGAVVEIGMPPLLIPNAPDGGPDRARIKAADSKLKGVMKAMGAQHGPVAALLPLLEAQKLGRGWVAGPLLQHGGKYANMALQAPIAGKLQGGGVYSQLNITLTGEESARFISTVQKTMAPNSSESGVLGQAFQELEKLASSQPGTPLNATLLNKALANTLAIPSILLQRSRTIGKIPDELDLSSTVKELYSLWIKDSVPNMLATTLADPRALSAYAAKAADVIRGKVPGVMKPFRDLLLANDREAAAWKGLATYVAANSFYPKDYEEAESITQHVPAEKKRDILARAAEIRDMMVPGDSGEFKDTEEADGSGGGVQNRFDARLAAYKQLVATTCAAELAIREADITNAEKQVNDEITALLRLIGTPVVVTSAPTQFGVETFGSGTGVRKDTHVKHPETEKTSSGLRHSVAEVRSDPAMALFYSDLWDKKP
ncbi:hypothetical protein PCA20602_00891 [Pandoraea capi]|uniref:Uncharacterized protein n=1 Tax=Pandoraea capi TaxID=2508286 RepID=A0ABY6VY12_9BURK|nr:hypothetical protein [Pandoraea capi]VVD76640.1 hypothetical protein PCA20602_00891 [Pandoraea capi]